MKFTEGGFRDWGYALAANEFGATPIDGGPWLQLEHEGPHDHDQGRDRRRVPAADPDAARPSTT